ncbi:MAG: penicillin-binding protein 1B [Chromatiales bacterium]|nr:penicillin-binding protein 1B [Gammaproteobacteria bacterium]MCP5351639.1 penicillin-binding protein 1B [Chromatiales bacterium]
MPRTPSPRAPRKRKTAKPPARRSPPKKTAGRGWKHYLLRVLLVAALVGGVVLAGYLLLLDRQVRAQFEGRQWALPAHVYARPLEVFAGMKLSADDLVAELDLLGYHADPDAVGLGRAGAYRLGGGRVELVSRAFTFWDGEEAGHAVRVRFDGGRVAALEALTGQAPALLRLDPLRIGGIYPTRAEDRSLLRLDDAPKGLTDALIAVEDSRFHEHHGIDPIGILRAVWHNLLAGRVVQGGSTLTQQLVKNLFLSDERSLQRKFNEASMAALLELHYGKEQILETYLNEVYLGQDGSRAIHGFGLGAEFYFGRPLNELRSEHLALLVGLVKGPSYYNPRRNPERAQARRDVVLAVMEREGLITSTEAVRARTAPLGLAEPRQAGGNRYPAFLDLVRRQLQRDYHEADLTSEGLRIFTTLDPRAQREAETRLGKRIGYLQERHGPKGVLEGAVVVVRPDNGEVQALVGGRDARFDGLNRALDAVRPIGSLIKPVVYLRALEEPARYSLATLLDDGPFSLRQAGVAEAWQPQNYDHEFHGKPLLIDALAHSYNPASARLGLALGLGEVHGAIRRLGVEREPPLVPAMLLGAYNLSPFEVAQLYQPIAAGGFRAPLRAIREVMNTDRQPLARYSLRIEQTFDSQVIGLLGVAMREVVRSGTARYLNRMLDNDAAVAGKTGTTDDLRDSWFAGFDASRLVVVWMGVDDNSRANLTGASGAMLVWGDVMRALGVDPLPDAPPPGTVVAEVDRDSGLLADAGCPDTVRLPFIAGSEPRGMASCAAVLGVPSAPTVAPVAQPREPSAPEPRQQKEASPWESPLEWLLNPN